MPTVQLPYAVLQHVTCCLDTNVHCAKAVTTTGGGGGGHITITINEGGVEALITKHKGRIQRQSKHHVAALIECHTHQVCNQQLKFEGAHSMWAPSFAHHADRRTLCLYKIVRESLGARSVSSCSPDHQPESGVEPHSNLRRHEETNSSDAFGLVSVRSLGM